MINIKLVVLTYPCDIQAERPC